MSRNFTADVDTQREYFNASYFNKSGQNQIAKYDTSLLKPMFQDPDKWKLAINRFRVPLSGIPLTKNNIPFDAWQVGLKYNNPTGTPSTYETFVNVPQYNPASKSVASYLTTTQQGNKYSIIEGEPNKNGNYVQNSSFNLAYPASVIPLSVGTQQYIFESFIGSKSITVYSPTYTVLQTINTTYEIYNMCLDSNNNLYICEALPPTTLPFVCVATYASTPSWTINESTNLYQSSNIQIFQANGLCAVGNSIYLADGQNNCVFYWKGGTAANPTNIIYYNNSYVAHRATTLNGQAVIDYEPTNPYIYDDLYVVNTNNQVVDYTNGQTQLTIGSISSQVIVTNPNTPGQSYLIGIGTDNNTYSQPMPTSPSATWTQINSTTKMTNIFYDATNNIIYGIGTDYNLYSLNFNQNNVWTLLYSGFNTLPNSLTFKSMSYEPSTNKVICTGSDNNIYESDKQLSQRTFFIPVSNGVQTGLQLMGMDNTQNGLKNFTNITKIPYGFENQSLGTPLATDGTYFYIQNSTTFNIDKMDNNLNVVASYSVSQIGAFGITYGPKSKRFYVSGQIVSGSNVNNGVAIYDSAFTYLGSITTPSQSPINPTVCEISDPTITDNLIMLYYNDNEQAVIMNINNIASPVIVVQPFNLVAFPMNFVFNPNDLTNGAGSVYYGDLEGNVYKITFNNNTYSAIASNSQIISQGGSQPWGEYIQVSPNLNEIYVLYSLNGLQGIVNNIYVYDASSYALKGIVPISNPYYPMNSFAVLTGGSYLQFNQVTSNNTIQSICNSYQSNFGYYGLHTDGTIYKGYRTGNTINWGQLSTNVYNTISCIGYLTKAPATTTSQFVTYSDTSIVSTTDSGTSTLNFLATTADNNLVYSAFNSASLTISNGLSYPISGVVNIYGYVQAPAEPVDSGPYSIYTYQGYLNQINLAFQNAFNNMKTTLGASYSPTEAPSIIYSAVDKLFSVVVEGQYLKLNQDGSNQYSVLFNQTLWNQFYFPSTDLVEGSNTYKSLIMQNYGTNAVVGTGSASLPQFIYVAQEESTIYAFYDLTRIIVGTTMIPVSGDADAKTFSNNNTVNNSSITMITDVSPDTSTLAPASALIYIPTGILRWYNLYAQQPFTRIDLIMYYETKDGSVYPIEVVDGEYFSVKLEFKKGPGDF